MPLRWHTILMHLAAADFQRWTSKRAAGSLPLQFAMAMPSCLLCRCMRMKPHVYKQHRLPPISSYPGCLQVGSCLGDAPCLAVWDLLSASVWWSAACAVSCMAVDPAHGCFAVALPPEPLRHWAPGSGGEPGARPNQATALGASPQPNGGDAAIALSLPDGQNHRQIVSPADGAAPMQINGGASPAQRQLPNGMASPATTSAEDSPMLGPARPAGSQEEAAAMDQAEDGGEDESADEEGGGALASLEAGAPLASGTFWYDEEEAGGPNRGGLLYGGGSGTVLLFEAGCPTPKQAWMMPR